MKHSHRIPFLAAFIATTAIAAAAPPVKVFILAGQSNMVGHGKVEKGRDPNAQGRKAPEVPGGLGSMRYLVKSDPAKYGALVDKDGKWLVRDDVWISSTGEGAEKGMLTVGFGKGGWIGPEYGFGWVVGEGLEEPVLLIKTSWGGKDLGVDFRPPSAGMPKYDLGKQRMKDGKPDPEIVGFYYRQMIENVQKVLADVGTEFPGLAGRKTEIVGFGWHQGWNDGGSADFVAEYESNLIHLIQDLRKDFGNDKLPVVIANSGFGGKDLAGLRLKLAEAQMAVAKRHEFKGTVVTVDTRPFQHSLEEFLSGFGYHWNHNGETHYLTGESMGKAMLELLGR
jgi:alpha-galactosidase